MCKYKKPEGRVQSVKQKVIIDCTRKGYNNNIYGLLYNALSWVSKTPTITKEEKAIHLFARKLANDMLYGRVIITIEPMEGVPIGKRNR